MSDELERLKTNELLLNMILVHFSMADTLTADDLKDYIDILQRGEDE